MTRLLTLFAVVCTTATVMAHHPERECRPARQRVDIIGPIGNRLPIEYRRQYNRPTNFGGRIAYWIAPSSQEAMAWHHATHRGNYEKKMPRTEMHYFFPKPWEVLQVGPRVERESAESAPTIDPQTQQPQPLEQGDALDAAPLESRYDASQLPASVIDLLEEV